MLNMGGPKDLASVESFLSELFSDQEIIKLPFQNILGPLISKRRTPKVRELYREIGGRSPILEFTQLQGEGITQRLDEQHPESSPHKHYIGFRYVPPRIRDTLQQMADDGVRRVVAFSQYPQFSCTTTGSSLNELWRELNDLGLQSHFEWSLIDRWPIHPSHINAVLHSIEKGFELFPDSVNRNEIRILFSAHSLPVTTILKGDHYAGEVFATVHAVMERYRSIHTTATHNLQPFYVCWQSQVGPKQWLSPQTEQVIRDLAARQVKHMLVVPIAFTTDHIETLSEIDIDFAKVAKQHGVENFIRAPAFNDDPVAIQALTDVVKDHLDSQQHHSPLYPVHCPSCDNPMCRTIINPAQSF
mmetsp:Transcript_15467/g.23192  ORF Transcript_15467/g.23192 Transcript_15467/m.23192 type:complete len:358 (+) Transcript_15467:91-1164(+)